MVFLMWWCGILAVFNLVFCVINMLNDKWGKATFHLVAGIWMWYVVTII